MYRPGGQMASYRQTTSFDAGSTHELRQYPDNSNGGYYQTTGQQQYSGYDEPSQPVGGYIVPQRKKKKSKWLIIGLPILVVVIIAAVLGGVLGERAASHSSTNDTSGSGSGATSGGTGTAAAVSTQTNAAGKVFDVQRIATGTDTYLLPIYPTATNTAVDFAPTTTANSSFAWPTDPLEGTLSLSASGLRPHPRLIAPSYKWEALPALIAQDAYLSSWNATIFQNASIDYAASPTEYIEDGGLTGSGLLDPARRIKLRIKNWGYVYKMTNDTKWADRAWTEINVMLGNDPSIYFGYDDTRWNPAHFLDTGEFTAAAAIAYDWFYDAWNSTQLSMLRDGITSNGLQWCIESLQQTNGTFDWWANGVTGNWNCVCNSGCTLGALAIWDDDTTGMANTTLSLTPANAKENCMMAVFEDGTWAETPNYWYFGTTGQAEMTSSLITATGSDQGLMAVNPYLNLSSLYHIYVQGMTSLFNYADHGPNKYTATANSLLFFGSEDGFNIPRYALYQREQYDASEPWAMFWYNPGMRGAWWDGLPLDHHFSNGPDAWASMRSSWADNNGLFVAMKAGNMTGHQTHGDIDAGDWVMDAMGQRWAGDLGSGNYLSAEYFWSEEENAVRWEYYRKRTEGQNTIVMDYLNQNTTSEPPTTFGSTGDTQEAAARATLDSNSAVYFSTDLTTAYNGTSIQRGIRMINQRRQVLIQDDIDGPNRTAIQWRMHTNATVVIAPNGTTATLTLANQTMTVTLLSPSTATFTNLLPIRYDTDPDLPAQPTYDDVVEQGDQPNYGDGFNTTVLAITLPGGSYSIQVLFNPLWDDFSDFITPNNVSVSEWSTTSHLA